MGRAVLVLEQEDPSPYLESIVEACLHNQAYDPQVEGDRVAYALDLVRRSRDPTYCRGQVLTALQTTSPDDHYDLEQLFGLAASFARDGDEAARSAMYSRFATKAADAALFLDAINTGAEQIIRLDGIAGFLFVAEHLGRRAMVDADFWADDYLLSVVEEQSDRESVKREIEQARRDNLGIDAYLKSVESTQREIDPADRRRKDWSSLGYDELKLLVGQGGRTIPILGFGRWGQSADERSLRRAAKDLLREDDPRRLVDFVRIFSKRRFPLDPQRLIDLAWSNDEKLAWAAGLALGNIRHPRIRQTALQFLADPTKRSQTIHLLAPNFEPGDHTLIEQALSTAPQDTEEEVVAYHHLGYDALDLVKANPTPEFATSLLTLYGRGPCSQCRERCVNLLRTLNRLPISIVEECRYDANLDFRAMVKTLE